MNFITDTIAEIKAMKPRSVSRKQQSRDNNWFQQRRLFLWSLHMGIDRLFHVFIADLPGPAVRPHSSECSHDLERHEAFTLDWESRCRRALRFDGALHVKRWCPILAQKHSDHKRRYRGIRTGWWEHSHRASCSILANKRTGWAHPAHERRQ